MRVFRSRARAFYQRQRFGALALDRWRADAGICDAADVAGLKRRERLFLLWRALRSTALLPGTAIRLVGNSFLFMLDFDRLHGAPRRQVRQGRGCVLDRATWLMNGANIVLGDFVKVSAFSSLLAGRQAEIRIGNYTIIGPGVAIVATNHGIARNGIPIRYQDWTEKTVDIGEDVWLGANAVVLPGTTIGSGAVVGAGTVVSGTIPPDTIVYQDRGSLVVRKRK